MKIFYNEIDPFAAAWLEELIAAQAIPDGTVDRRDIRDIRPDDLADFDQCHFFAGIAGWSEALRLAGLSGMHGVWTGSCPCQPFSAAGKALGFADERHLWPAFFHLIDKCRPPVVLGEQVASKAGLEWFDLVQSDLEGAGYAVGAADLCAAGCDAPHIRQRLWWVADSTGRGCREFGDALEPGRGRHADSSRFADELVAAGYWDDIIWLPCRDGKARPTQPGIQPLAYGVPNRVGTLRGAGNSIVPPLAAEFILAALEPA